ncbi:hypothetical protein ASPVEDRAFT_81397 [Aspergillus versicolor CBS 583.65]|uniref:Uncharacterized protein n=1 Tax=Aspergillus versicolor CBS 583.65 TaxID=1036611 RepID=A0A1L9PE50_ASPVE|nr:uncharacterized protein ASPVEDRAFT_81397 [Aspergillus versicolor CBS 583.65]OJI99806.1 hypothetical protein ASPVEDRAFT_81397 [Aspergillus versicolor CBS 583.65]
MSSTSSRNSTNTQETIFLLAPSFDHGCARDAMPGARGQNPCLAVDPYAMTEFESTLTAQGTEGCRRFLDSGISKYEHPELCVSRALIIALGQGHSSIAEILLERSTPEGELMAYEMWGVTPLHIAVALDDEAMVELLLMSNASPQRQLRDDLVLVIFMLEALGERSGVFRQLYYQYMRLPISTPLGTAVENGNRSLVDALRRRDKNTYLLHALVWCERDTWLRELLPDYLDNVNQPDETGSTPLHFAVMVKSAPCIDMLLSAHADGTLLNLDGLSPAHMAIEKQLDIGICERLMESIDDANMAKLSRNFLTSVLNHASPSRALVRALLNRGASIDGIPARDWWKALGPPERDNDSHIHISRSMNQTYSIHRCYNVNFNVLDLPAYFCDAHSEINMLLLPKSCIDPSFRSRLDPSHAMGPLSFRVFNHDRWERKAILPQLTHLTRLPQNKFFITFSISIKCPEGLQDKPLANAQDIPPEGQFIGWVLTRAESKGSEDRWQDAKPYDSRLRVVTYFSTLDCGWIPESPAELCLNLLVEMNSDWHLVYEQSLQYLNRMRIKVLQQEGRNKRIIRELLRASLDCSRLVSALQLQVHRITSQVEVYRTHDYLRDSLHDDSALGNVSTSTEQLEKDVKMKISELSQLTQDLITLEFSLVSIHEAQLSTSMSVSMKRLSWITFIYLPLTFAASVFGANINVLADNPGWWWMAILAGALMFMTFSGWVLFKYTELENHLETAGDGIYSTIANRFGGRNRTDREQGIKDALE